MFKLLSTNATLPVRATSGSAGYDLYAAETKLVTSASGTVLIKTNIAAQCPPGTYGRIAIRSSLAYKHHLAVSAGVIDSDYYPNDIGVLVYCTKPGYSYEIKQGERFAQIVFEKIYIGDDKVVTERTGGYGSTNEVIELPSYSDEWLYKFWERIGRDPEEMKKRFTDKNDPRMYMTEHNEMLYNALIVPRYIDAAPSTSMEDVGKSHKVVNIIPEPYTCPTVFRSVDHKLRVGETENNIPFAPAAPVTPTFKPLTPALDKLMNGSDDDYEPGVL